MIEKVKLAILKTILNKYALGYLVKGWAGIKGYKTQIVLAVGIGVKVLKTVGYLPKEVAEPLYPYLLGASAVTLMQKLQRYQPIIDELIQGVRKKSEA